MSYKILHLYCSFKNRYNLLLKKLQITTKLLLHSTVSQNTTKVSLNTTETQLSHEVCMIIILLIMPFLSYFKIIIFTSQSIT
jgi:hypothetical protein